ncbi:MAG: hypothetical protein AAFU85_11545 [Planctomycetota bacterium]
MAIQLYRDDQPTVLPFSVDEARDELELVGHAHDSKIIRKIHAATRIWERYTKRAAVPQTWVYVVESELAAQAGHVVSGGLVEGRAQTETALACRPVLELPRPPVISVDKVESREDIEDDYSETDAADFKIEADSAVDDIGRVIWLPGKTVPSFRRITFSCGYDGGELPPECQETILKMVVHSFHNRGDMETKWPTALKSELHGQIAGNVGVA